MGVLINLLLNFPPYKFIIDTCSILSQKQKRVHNKKIYKTLWLNIEKLIKIQEIVICSEIRDEIKDIEILKWLEECNCAVINVDELIQTNVKKIVTEHPKLVNFKSSTSSGDAFLIATALSLDLTIITEENKNSEIKIPKIAQSLGLKSINIQELCELKQWKF
jgi:hypothetical protein